MFVCDKIFISFFFFPANVYPILSSSPDLLSTCYVSGILLGSWRTTVNRTAVSPVLAVWAGTRIPEERRLDHDIYEYSGAILLLGDKRP